MQQHKLGENTHRETDMHEEQTEGQGDAQDMTNQK